MTASAESASRSYAFGQFVFIPDRQTLLQGEVPVRIGGRALDILTTLVERPGELVTKSELMARVWPDIFVVENNLKVNIAVLRRSLGDETGSAKYIATVPGRGYRFIAPVEVSSLASASGAPIPALLCGVAASAAQTALIRAVYPR